jgi:SPP1 gp7 family putative phage head morphogenesis protein
MIDYDLAELATPPRGKKRVLLPTISESLRAEQAYLKVIRGMLQGLLGAVRDEIVPEALREVQGSRLTTDAMAESSFERMRALAAALAETASRMVDRIFSLESQRHTEKFIQTAMKVLGIDLRAVVRQQDLGDLLSAVSIRNAALIKDIGQETIANVARVVTNSVLSGQGHQFLRSELKGVFEMSDNRAKLIARDQTAKLNSDLNRFRQDQAGVDKYVWRTSQDERVRARHRGLEGKVYEWGEPTGAEDGLPPGQPIQCRCVAQGVVEF